MNPIKAFFKRLRDALVQGPKTRYNFTPRAEIIFRLADEEARKLKHDAIRPEHLLYGLAVIGHGVAANILKRCEVDATSVLRELQKTHATSVRVDTTMPLASSVETNQVLEIADNERRSFYHTYLGTEHLLLALLQFKHPSTEFILRSLNLDVAQVRREVLKELDPNYDAQGCRSSSYCADVPMFEYMPNCSFCGIEIAETTKKCPNCRRRLRGSLFRDPLVTCATVVCSAIGFAYFQTFTTFSTWVSGLFSILISIGLISLLWRIGD